MMLLERMGWVEWEEGYLEESMQLAVLCALPAC